MELARRLGVAKRTVERWEVGENEPDAKQYHALVRVLGPDIMPDLLSEQVAALQGEVREARALLLQVLLEGSPARNESELDALIARARRRWLNHGQ